MGAPSKSGFDRGTSNRLGGPDPDRARGLAATDDLVAGLDVAFHGDPKLLIAQAKLLADRFESDDPDLPRIHHARALQLLSIYRELCALAQTSPRDDRGALLTEGIWGNLEPWDPSRPTEVDALEVFLPERTLAWEIEAHLPSPPPPPPPPPRQARGTAGSPARVPLVLHGPPPPIRLIEEPQLPPGPRYVDPYEPKPPPPAPPKPKPTVWIIKTPRMTFATPSGTAAIWAAVLRAMLQQRITEPQAEALVAQLSIQNSIPPERQTSFDADAVGSMMRVTLEAPFLEKLKALPLFRQSGLDLDDYHQRLFVPRDPNALQKPKDPSIEIFPDFSAEDRAFYVLRQLCSTFRAKGSPLVPGQIYGNGLLFVRWGKPVETGDASDLATLMKQTVWLTPDGRLLFMNYDAYLEAYAQGVSWASGGVTLAWATIAVGVLSFGAPYLLGLAEGGYTALQVAAGSAPSIAGATVPAISVFSSGAVIYLGQNWQWIDPLVQAAVNLGNNVYELGLRGFIDSLNPAKAGFRGALVAWANLFVNLLSGGHALSQSGLGGGGARPPALPPPGVDEEPDPTPTPASRGVPSTEGEPDQPPATDATAPTVSPPSTERATGQAARGLPSVEDTANERAGRQSIANAQSRAAVAKKAPAPPNENAPASASAHAPVAELEPQVEPAPAVNENLGEQEDEGELRMAANGGRRSRARSTAQKSSSSRATQGRATGGGTGTTGVPPVVPPRPIVIDDAVAKKLGLTPDMQEVAVHAATLYREEQANQELYGTGSLSELSVKAHANALARLAALHPDAIEPVEGAPTGVTGPASSKGGANVREVDIGYTRPGQAGKGGTNFHLIFELKRTAFPTESEGEPVLYTYGQKGGASSGQIQALEVAKRFLRIPVLVIDSRGRIYGFDGSTWIAVGGPVKPN